MQRIVAGITPLEQHVETTQKGAEVYRPKSCPYCGLEGVHQHGHYERKADRRAVPPRLNPIPILRYRCAGCRRTCSRLPECIAPRRWYDWSIQQRVLQQRLTGAAEPPGGPPDRHTGARWWNWLQERGEDFVFQLRARFAELGRAVDAHGFWHQVFDSLGLPRAMFWLDQEMSVT